MARDSFSDPAMQAEADLYDRGHPYSKVARRRRSRRSFTAAQDERVLNRPFNGKISKDVDVRGMQAFLRKRGYNIAVDGINGPMTRAAAQAFRHGVKADKWNSKFAQIDDANRHNTPPNANNQRSGGPPRAGAHRQGKAMRVGGLPEESAGNALFPGIDPDVYARAMANAEFDPQLGELSREEGRVRVAGKHRIAEMADMYRALQSHTTARNAEDEAARQRAIAQIAGMGQGIGQGIALGEGVGADLAGHGDIAADTARLMGVSAQKYGSDILGAQERGAIFESRQARNTMDEALEELYGKRRDLLAQKGAKRTGLKSELMKWATETGMAQQALGLDTAKTYAGLAATREQIRSSREMSGINKTRARADLIRAQKAGAAGDKPFPSKFRNLNPKQRREVGDAVLNTIGDYAVNNPDNAQSIVRMINSSLKSYGFKPGNPLVGMFALDLYRRATGKPGDSRWWGLGKGR